jgi:hypothetical protein
LVSDLKKFLYCLALPQSGSKQEILRRIVDGFELLEFRKKKLKKSEQRKLLTN